MSWFRRSTVAIVWLAVLQAGCVNIKKLEIQLGDTDAPGATCADDLENGDESDVDCGGSCDPCATGRKCTAPSDCAEGVCEDGVCAAATCDDRVSNGSESDVDCGGSCDPCSVGRTCDDGDDCTSGVCDDEVCQAPTCDDNVRNGNEIDVDCGAACGPCGRGSPCLEDEDCTTNVCLDQVCERAVVISGRTVSSNPFLDGYVSQSITRVDFTAPPTVIGFDGTAQTLPVSMGGSFESATLSPSLTNARLILGGVELAGADGYTYYQSIEPTFYGVVMRFMSPAAAQDAYDALSAAGLADTEIELLIVDQ